MTETTTVDLLDTVRVHETAGTSGKVGATQAPVVIATMEDIRAGSVLIRSDVRLPGAAHFESKRYGGWKVLTGVNGFSVERALSEAGFGNRCRLSGHVNCDRRFCRESSEGQ
jgi:hypothetical protein